MRKRLLYGTVLAVSILMVAVVFAQTYPTGMVSYWKLDEGGGSTAVDSIGTNHGTIYGATPTTGQVVGALSFDGIDDNVNVSETVNLDGFDAITIEAWIKPTENQYSGLVTKGQYGGVPSGPRYQWSYSLTLLSGRNIYWSVYDGPTAYDRFELRSVGILPLGTWSHVAVTWDNNIDKARFYINGEFDYEADTTIGHMVDNDLSLYIGKGRNVRYGDTHFKGLMDEVAIYNRALTLEEVQQHYQNGLNGIGYEESLSAVSLKNEAIEDLEALKTGDEKTDKNIDKAIKHISKSLDAKLWIDENRLDTKHGQKVFNEEKKAVKKLRKLCKKASGVCPYDDVINKLVLADESLATTAIEDAKATTVVDPKKQDKVDREIAKAEKELAKAAEKLSQGKPDKTIKHLKKAWKHAQHAIKHAQKTKGKK